MHHENEKLSKVFSRSYKKNDAVALEIGDLSRIFFLAYSITGRVPYGDNYHYYRSVASAGALYPAEIYVAAHDVEDLQDGLYHFSIADHALARLRSEDMSGWISECLYQTFEKHPLLIFFFTAIFFRSAWKYRERAYRYNLLDTGHLIENLVVALKAEGLPFCLSYDFDDQAINRILGLDEQREVCLAVCPVSDLDTLRIGDGEKDIADLTDSIKGASRVSNKEVEYPAIADMHMAGILRIPAKQQRVPDIEPVCTSSGRTIKIKDPITWPEKTNYEDAFLLRRSRRNFIPTLLSRTYLTALLECLTMDSRFVSSGNEYHRCVRTGLIIENVEGLEPGFYLTDALELSFERVDAGSFTGLMASICLDQRWLANAAVHFLFITDLKKLEQSYGPRGYRYAMLHSGRLGGSLYLAATAMGLGCCGIGAFYDTEAAQLLKLRANSRLLYLVAVGPVRQRG